MPNVLPTQDSDLDSFACEACHHVTEWDDERICFLQRYIKVYKGIYSNRCLLNGPVMLLLS